MKDIKKWEGCLMGLACGDAVGASVEFMDRGSFPEVTDMNGGGPFNLPKGYYTDDTIMAVCLAESLIQCKGFNAENQMDRYINWYEYGYNSPTGVCFDIGFTTATALEKYKEDGNPFAGNISMRASGNGGIMRLAPIPMTYKYSQDAAKYSKEMSRTTHASEFCLTCSDIFGSVLWLALHNYSKQEISDYIQVRLFEEPVFKKVPIDVLKPNYMDKTIHEIKGSGFVLESLEAALWCFFKTDNYKDAVLMAVNLGDDTDTTGAIVGQLAGAYYGIDSIPLNWREQIYNHDGLIQLSRQLYDMSCIE